jgi:fatty-acyl-CoA synthase
MQHSMSAPIYSGASVVLMTRWDREVAAGLVERYGCTHWTNISTMVVDFLSNSNVGQYDLHSLVFVGGGGAPLPAAVGEKLEEYTGVRYAEGYGLSETIAQTHMNPPDRPKLQCLGIPSFDVDSRVIDPDTLEEMGPNQEGEIISSGPQVMKGYWQRPKETEAAFIERDSKRFLRTGDMGMYDEEGYFFIVDRLKRMINAGGFKVWPSEVESTLYKHPAIQEACVIGVPDPRRGETTKAFVVLREEERGKVTPEEIIEWAEAQMAAYKYPRIVEFTNALPKSGTGKILWRELQEQEQQKGARTG